MKIDVFSWQSSGSVLCSIESDPEEVFSVVSVISLVKMCVPGLTPVFLPKTHNPFIHLKATTEEPHW